MPICFLGIGWGLSSWRDELANALRCNRRSGFLQAEGSTSLPGGNQVDGLPPAPVEARLVRGHLLPKGAEFTAFVQNPNISKSVYAHACASSFSVHQDSVLELCRCELVEISFARLLRISDGRMPASLALRPRMLVIQAASRLARQSARKRLEHGPSGRWRPNTKWATLVCGSTVGEDLLFSMNPISFQRRCQGTIFEGRKPSRRLQALSRAQTEWCEALSSHRGGTSSKISIFTNICVLRMTLIFREKSDMKFQKCFQGILD